MQANDVVFITQRFALTQRPTDPTAIELPSGSESWPRRVRESLSRDLRPAGVLIPIVRREYGLKILFTRRADTLVHHPGQVSFPGGSMETGDADIVETALRETHEEVGIAPEHVSVIGYLRATPTISGYAVTPTIGVVETMPELALQSSEVASAFEVPLDFLLETSNYQRAYREYQGHRLPVVEVHYEEHRIWGATANMLFQFVNFINKQ